MLYSMILDIALGILLAGFIVVAAMIFLFCVVSFIGYVSSEINDTVRAFRKIFDRPAKTPVPVAETPKPVVMPESVPYPANVEFELGPEPKTRNHNVWREMGYPK